MARKKVQPATPPIPDVNRNGILDGQDILTQLAIEDADKGDIRTPNQRAHGVLENLHVRDTTTDITQHALHGDALTADAFAILAQQLNTVITATAKGTNDLIARDPDVMKKSLAALRQRAAENHESPEQLAIDLADRTSFIDFAKSMATTFPKGVKIEAKDMKDILSHFGVLVIIEPGEPLPTHRQPLRPGEVIASTGPKGRFI